MRTLPAECWVVAAECTAAYSALCWELEKGVAGSRLREVGYSGSGRDWGSSWSWAAGTPCRFSLMGVIKRHQWAHHLMSLCLQAAEVTLGGWVCTEGQRSQSVWVHVTTGRVFFSAPGSVAMEASSDGEEDAESTDKVTETVMNGGMKETLSLTVDAKTETAVFKR